MLVHTTTVSAADDFPLSTCACFNARTAARAITALYDSSLEPAGIRTTQFAMLVAIQVRGSITMPGNVSCHGLCAGDVACTSSNCIPNGGLMPE